MQRRFSPFTLVILLQIADEPSRVSSVPETWTPRVNEPEITIFSTLLSPSGFLYAWAEDGEPEASHPAGVEGALERLSMGRQHQEELPQRNHLGLSQSCRSLSGTDRVRKTTRNYCGVLLILPPPWRI